MLGHLTCDVLDKHFRLLQKIHRRHRDEELNDQPEQQMQLESQEHLESPTSTLESPTSPQHHHKPKQDTFYTKQQLRQQRKLKHLHEGEQQSSHDSPKLHHRAWSALPVEGDGVWQHSLESPQESNSLV